MLPRHVVINAHVPALDERPEALDAVGVHFPPHILPSSPLPMRHVLGVGNAAMGAESQGLDYGVFEFGNLFSEAILGRPYQELSTAERSSFTARFEHKVSDHMPMWVRLPLPVD